MGVIRLSQLGYCSVATGFWSTCVLGGGGCSNPSYTGLGATVTYVCIVPMGHGNGLLVPLTTRLSAEVHAVRRALMRQSVSTAV